MTPACFTDSNIWLYIHLRDQDEVKREQCRTALTQHRFRRVISTQVVAEVACNLIKRGRVAEPAVRQVLTSMQSACDVVPVTIATGMQASLLREAHTFSYWDSLIIAAALESGCTELWSEDLQHGRVVDGHLRIVNPLLPTT